MTIIELTKRGLFKFRTLWTNRRYHEILERSVGSRINPGTEINDPSHFFLGERSYINGGAFTTGPSSVIRIGKDCLISYNVFMRTVSHNYQDKSLPINEQGHWEADIVIEDDVWVGNGAMISAGVTLHKGCVIGMGAIVTKDIPEYAIAVGCPARVIKERR